HVQTKAIGVLLLQRVERLDTVERLFPVAGNAADAIVRLAITVECDIQVEIYCRVVTESAIDDVVHARFDESIRGNNDAIDAVVRNEEIDDVGKIASQCWHAAGEPEVSDRRHGP